jgi:hypothetical protein
MANGDLASSFGLFTPVSPGAEYRLGYDDINRLADAVARVNGGNAWSLSAITLTAAAAAGSLTDPADATTGVLVGGAKLLGVGQVWLSFRLRLSTAITFDATGEAANVAVAKLGAPYRPPTSRYIRWTTAAGSGAVQVNNAGDVLIIDGPSNNTINTTTHKIQIDGGYPL